MRMLRNLVLALVKTGIVARKNTGHLDGGQTLKTTGQLDGTRRSAFFITTMPGHKFIISYDWRLNIRDK